MRSPRSVLTLVLGVGIGFAVAGGQSITQVEARPAETYDHLDVFAEVLTHVQNRYVDDVDAQALVYGAIRGMVGELDRHSRFMDEDEFSAMRDDTRGEYVGVGMEIRQTDEGVRVGEVFEGGPAFDGGIQRGDLILRIDDEDATEFSTADVVGRLRGLRGDPVTVEVERPDEGSIVFELVRDVIQMVAVEEYMVAPSIGLVEMNQFQSGVGNDVRSAIDRLQAESDGELAGLVLDLRNNPGGLLSEAIAVSDAFLNEGTIVSTAGRIDGEDEEWSAGRSSTRFNGPLVVLVNGGSASASEIVAGALQDNGRAYLVGTLTYGKGSVQSIIDLSNGAGLKLTVSRYYTPSGRSIHELGIEPDLVVEADAVSETDGSGGVALDPTLAEIGDDQLRAAVAHLMAAIAGTPPE